MSTILNSSRVSLLPCGHKPSLPRIAEIGTKSAVKASSSSRFLQKKRVGVLALAAAPSETPSSLTVDDSIPTLKSKLLDLVFGTDRGLTARGQTKAEISELITKLESQNPTPSPSSARAMLNGNWKLVYTTSPGIVALLALNRLPFVKIGDLTQKIDGPSLTVENTLQISVPFSRTAFSTTASWEAKSPARNDVSFEEGIIRTPELMEDIEIPSSITVMGQTVDTSAVASALQSPVRDAVAQIGSIISQQPDLKIPIQGNRAKAWILTTYLDADTRIMRGERGVYVLVKDVSISSPVEVKVEEPESSETNA